MTLKQRHQRAYGIRFVFRCLAVRAERNPEFVTEILSSALFWADELEKLVHNPA